MDRSTARTTLSRGGVGSGHLRGVTTQKQKNVLELLKSGEVEREPPLDGTLQTEELLKWVGRTRVLFSFGKAYLTACPTAEGWNTKHVLVVHPDTPLRER